MTPGLRILLIDHDTRTARRLASMLEEDGYEVDLVYDARTAMDHLERVPLPDVVVTDYLLPGQNGLAIMDHARRAKPELPVIFVTGYPDLLARAPERSAPAPIVFTKPLSYGALHDVLGRLAGEERKAP